MKNAHVESLPSWMENAKVLAVDGGSDGTSDLVRKLSTEFPDLRYIHNENDRGKGHAVRTGIEASKADIMAQIDGDMQFLPEERRHFYLYCLHVHS